MGVIAGNLVRSAASEVTKPSLIVAQATGKIVHVSDEGALFLGKTNAELLGRNIRDVLMVAMPPKLAANARLRRKLWGDGSWIGRVNLAGPDGDKAVQLRWRQVPMGWLSYWLLTLEEGENNQEDPLIEGFFNTPENMTRPAFTMMQHPSNQADRWRLTSFHRPIGAAGGDVLFIEELGHGHILYFLGDVAGHHRGATLVRLMLTTYLRVYRQEFNPNSPHRFPGLLLGRMNRALAQDAHNDCLMTAVALVLEKRSNRAFFASAGHHPVFLVRPGRKWQIFTTPDIPLGIKSRQRYRSTEITCIPGDRLLCYTDGLITAGHRIDFRSGLKSLLDTLEKYRDASSDELAGRIQKLWHDTMNSTEAFKDDVTFTVISQSSRVSNSPASPYLQ